MGRAGLPGAPARRSPTRRSCSPSAGRSPADEPAPWPSWARGARASYGRRVAEELARGLAAVGLTVVSGLATGIDAAAHRGALAAGGRTVAVLGDGHRSRVSALASRRWPAEVAASGALVTEFPCGTPPLPYHFPRRNRIISGLDAGHRGGRGGRRAAARSSPRAARWSRGARCSPCPDPSAWRCTTAPTA